MTQYIADEAHFKEVIARARISGRISITTRFFSPDWSASSVRGSISN